MAMVPPDPYAGRPRGPRIIPVGALPNQAQVPGGGMTLDALIARQKQLASDKQTLPDMQSPMQGLAYAVQQGMHGFQEGRAERQLGEGRAALAQAMTQFDPNTGEFSPEAIATMGALDPEHAFAALHDMAASRQRKQELSQSHDWEVQGREDTQQAAADLAAQSQGATAEQNRLQREADDARQRAQDATAANRQDDAQQAQRDLAVAQAGLDRIKADEDAKREAALPQTETAKAEADFKAGRISQQERDAAIAKANYVAPTKPGDLFTPGQAALDQKAAPEVLEWKQTGGPTTLQQVTQVDQALKILEQDPSWLTGATGAKGAIPAVLQPFLNEKGVIAGEAIKQAVQATLRQTLGSQYTQKEGEDLMARAYNPMLPPAENVRRVKLLMTQVAKIAEARQAMVNHWDKYGTLSNYTGPQYNVRDIYSIDLDTPAAGAAAGAGGGAGGDPNDPLNLRKKPQ